MTTPQTNFSILDVFPGSDFVRGIHCTEIENAPDELIGYALFAQMRKNHESKKYWEFEIVKNDTDFVMFMDSSITKTIPPGHYNYDVVTLHTSGVRSVLIQGRVNVIPTYTS